MPIETLDRSPFYQRVLFVISSPMVSTSPQTSIVSEETSHRTASRDGTKIRRVNFNDQQTFEDQVGPPLLTASCNGAPRGLQQSLDHVPFERQLSPIDPMSDRVSTILVWQNLTVQIREDKRKEFFQRMKSYKKFVPKRKCLLHKVSGAITGGLWGVMGNSLPFSALSCPVSLSLS